MEGRLGQKARQCPAKAGDLNQDGRRSRGGAEVEAPGSGDGSHVGSSECGRRGL